MGYGKMTAIEPGTPGKEEGAERGVRYILIADDDLAVLSFMAVVLKKPGFRVETVDGGKACIESIRKEQPDLLLLDLFMPLYGGFEVLHSLQSMPDRSSIPVIVITGRTSDRPMIELVKKESNVVDFLEKPIKPAFLAMAVHNAFKKMR